MIYVFALFEWVLLYSLIGLVYAIFITFNDSEPNKLTFRQNIIIYVSVCVIVTISIFILTDNWLERTLEGT